MSITDSLHAEMFNILNFGICLFSNNGNSCKIPCEKIYVVDLTLQTLKRMCQ